MKKILYLIGICATLFSCTREVEPLSKQQKDDNTVVIPADLPSNIPASFTASIANEEKSGEPDQNADTKTTYEGGQAKWVVGNQVALLYVDNIETPANQGWIAYSVTSVENDGKMATFTIVDGQTEKIEALASYESTGVAIYPASVARPHTANTEAIDGDFNHKPFITIPTTQTGNYSDVIMLGKTAIVNGSTMTVDFKTAMSILKVTVTGIPAEASKFQFYSNNADVYPSGDFLIDINADAPLELTKDSYHTWGGGYHSGKQSITINRISDWDDGSQDFYLNVPTGAYAAGAITLKLLDGSDNILMEKPIKSEFTFERNKMITGENGAGIPLATEWHTLGTGKFHDNFYLDSYKLTNWNWADVTIQQNIANTNQYRIVDPYKAYSTANSYTQPSASDAYLVFTVNKISGLVQFEDCFTGIRFTYDYTISYNKWNGTANEGPSYNKVIASSSGEPTCIQLAPYYCWKDKTNGYSKYNINGLIMIEFPDYDTSISPVSSSLATSLSPEVSLIGNNLSKFKVGFGASSSAAISAIAETEYNPEAPASITIPSDGIATYYVAFKPTYSSGRTLSATAYPFYTLSTTAEETYAKQFSGAFIMNYTSGDVGANTITFAVSDNPFKGNIMITEFDGLSYDVSENTHSALNSTGFYDGADFSQYSDGNPVYGYYNGSSSYPNTTFYNVMDQVFYYDANGSAHYIVGDSVNTNPASGGTLTNLQFAFGSSTAYYRSTVYPVVCWSRWIGNYWKLGNSTGYDYELFQYGAAAQ